MRTIKLKKPLKINGKIVTELTYDVDEITADAFAEAEARKFQATRTNGSITSAALELDYTMHLYLGFAAILAINRDYDYNDMCRMAGRDLIEVQKIGRSFMLASGEESEETESEADKSENA